MIGRLCGCISRSSPISNDNGNSKDKNKTAVIEDENLVLSLDERITTLQRANLQWGLLPEVKKTLDQLFEGSLYSIDTLPFYPSNSEDIKREIMEVPIMKGTLSGKRFIAIKLDTYLTNNYIKTKIPSAHHSIYKANRQRKELLVLAQAYEDGPSPHGYGDGVFAWNQSLGKEGRSTPTPSFFTSEFTNLSDGSGPTFFQKDNFAKVQTLIQTGEGKDENDLIWKIPKESITYSTRL